LGRPSLRQKSAQFLTHGSRPVQLPTRRPGSHSNKGTSNKGAQLQLEIGQSAKAPAAARRSAGGLVDTASRPLHLPLALRLHASTLGAMFPLAVLEHLHQMAPPDAQLTHDAAIQPRQPAHKPRTVRLVRLVGWNLGLVGAVCSGRDNKTRQRTHKIVQYQ
jgi:hypothetical protein